jgi:Cu(I)/Ag(I) efflux system membrane fusion protein
VLDSGIRQLVLVDLGEGRFEPRPLKLGIRADGYAEVLGGLEAGEAVVVSANFLIDAESNLKAALGGFGHHPGSASGENGQTTPGAPMPIGGGTPGPASHHGTGNITEMDWTHATVTIAHDAIASLNWPAMTMDLRVRNPALLRPLKPGQKVDFEIAEESAGEYVIVRIQPPNASPTVSDERGH